MRTQDELNELDNEEFVQAIRNAIRIHGTLRKAVKANGWEYNQIYGRLHGLGKRLRWVGKTKIIDVEEE